MPQHSHIGWLSIAKCSLDLVRMISRTVTYTALAVVASHLGHWFLIESYLELQKYNISPSQLVWHRVDLPRVIQNLLLVKH